MVLSHTVEPVGVGCPNPFGRGNLAPTIEDVSVAGDSILPLAPEGRHVYSRAGYTNILKPQRGDMC